VNLEQERLPRNKTGTAGEKWWLPKVLTFIFITAGLTLLVYFGVTQAGKTDGVSSVKNGFHKTEMSNGEFPADLPFPEMLPFEAIEISPEKTNKFTDNTTYIVSIKGAEEKLIVVRYTPGTQFVDQTDPALPEEMKETSVDVKAVKVEGNAGNYHETKYESILSWQEDDYAVTISYHRGGSGEIVGKEELITVAESFK
jgi:hypothetical protein